MMANWHLVMHAVTNVFTTPNLEISDSTDLYIATEFAEWCKSYPWLLGVECCYWRWSLSTWDLYFAQEEGWIRLQGRCGRSSGNSMQAEHHIRLCRISDANFRNHILPCSGDLNHQNEPLTPGALRLLIWQLLVAVQYMHSCHVWHRYVLWNLSTLLVLQAIKLWYRSITGKHCLLSSCFNMTCRWGCLQGQCSS